MDNNIICMTGRSVRVHKSSSAPGHELHRALSDQLNSKPRSSAEKDKIVFSTKLAQLSETMGKRRFGDDEPDQHEPRQAFKQRRIEDHGGDRLRAELGVRKTQTLESRIYSWLASVPTGLRTTCYCQQQGGTKHLPVTGTVCSAPSNRTEYYGHQQSLANLRNGDNSRVKSLMLEIGLQNLRIPNDEVQVVPQLLQPRLCLEVQVLANISGLDELTWASTADTPSDDSSYSAVIEIAENLEFMEQSPGDADERCVRVDQAYA